MIKLGEIVHLSINGKLTKAEVTAFWGDPQRIQVKTESGEIHVFVSSAVGRAGEGEMMLAEPMEARELARLILAGKEVRMPVSAQLNMLAVANLAMEAQPCL